MKAGKRVTVASDTKKAKDKASAGQRPCPPGPALRSLRPIINLLESLPSPAVFWSLQRHFCIPNRKACQWVDSAKNDFREYGSSWAKKVHALERPRFYSVWELLQSEEVAQCDYRFAPDGREGYVWLRESSTCYRNWRGEAEGLISLYTDISDLKPESLIEPAEPKQRVESPSLRKLAHELANCIHYISMELELMSLNSETPVPVELLDNLNRLHQYTRQLLDCRVSQDLVE